MEKGLIIRKEADQFLVELENEKNLICKARKILKKEGVFVGDKIFLDDDNAICQLEKRKNVLIRPPLSNLDKMFIVVAPVPKPDLYLVDKLILFCKLNDIEPMLCINKSDLDKKYCEKLLSVYNTLVEVIVMSTLDKSVIGLKKHIDGICALAGQSAVGKSSIINALVGEKIAKVDNFSKKIERGKQTTRTVHLFKFGDGKYLADTAGFSKLDETLLNLKPEEIKDFYPEFVELAHMCKYKSCLHINDKDCAVRKAVRDGTIEKCRYENYLKLLEVVKNIKHY